MDNAEKLIQQIEQPLHDLHATPMLYLVKAGDTLSQIIARHYDIAYTDPRYQMAQASVLYFNESLKDPNEIYAGQLLRLMPLPSDHATAYCPVPDGFHQHHRVLTQTRHQLEPAGDYPQRFKHHIPLSPEEQDAFWALSWLEENYSAAGSIGIGSGLNTLGGLVSQSNNAFIAEVKSLYNLYQRGAITQNQYNYRRQLALKAYAQKIGPSEKLLFKGKTVREVVRINRSKALPATAKIDHQLQRLGRMARYAKHGGVILTAASVGIACHDIAQARTQQKKNEIFVETVGSTIVGTLGSMALGVFLVSNPVGWGVALVLGTATALGSYGAGKAAGVVYDNHFREHDLVRIASIDEICK